MAARRQMRLGVLVFVLCTLALPGVKGKAQVAISPIIINEFRRDGQFTNSEYIEFLLTSDQTATQLETFYWGDSTDPPDAKYGKYQFKGLSNIATNFKAGTIIVVGGTTAISNQDTSYNPIPSGTDDDWNIMLKIGSSFISSSGNSGDFAVSDLVWVDTSNSETTSLDSIAWPTTVSGAFGTAAKVKIDAPSNGGNVEFTGNGSELNQVAAYSFNSTGSIGSPNGGNNTTYIMSLRNPAPTVSSTSPVNNTADISANANLEITFSEDVTVSDGWFNITCDNTTYAATVSNTNPSHYTLTPATKLPYGKSCTVTIDKDNIADRDGTAENMPADYSFSFNVIANKVPTISDRSKSGTEDSTITFAETDFSGGFSDGDNDSLTKVKITALPTSGKLQLNGTDLAKDVEILAVNLGKLTYIPQADFNGPDSFSWNGSDGTDFAANAGLMNITIASINDAPSFSKGSDQEVDENAETQEIEKWATAISPGPPDEANQTLTFEVTNDKSELFADQPALDAAGKLTYTPKANVSGTAKVTVVLNDDGGIADGGKNTSAAQVFEITIIPAPTATPTPTNTATATPSDTPTSTSTPTFTPSATNTSDPLPKITQPSAPFTPSPLSLDTPTAILANKLTTTVQISPTKTYLPPEETILPEPSDLPLATLTDDLPLPPEETVSPEPSDLPLATLTDDFPLPPEETVLPEPSDLPLATLTATSLPTAETILPSPINKPKVTHSPTSSPSSSPSSTASPFPTLSPTFQPKPQVETETLSAQYLPFVFKGANESGATEERGQPDLIGSFTIEPKKQLYQAREPITFTVVITNLGTVATTNGFWADLYLDPSEIPSVNKRWDKVCGPKTCFGIAWQITTSLAPGASLTLTSQSANYDLTQSFWPGWFAEGTRDLYLLVDSWNLATATGGIAEGAGEGNNLFHFEELKVEEVDP